MTREFRRSGGRGGGWPRLRETVHHEVADPDIASTFFNNHALECHRTLDRLVVNRAGVVMRELAASILLTDGPAEIKAPDGTFDYDAETVSVRGPVEFQAAGGYRMSTSAVTIDLKQQHVTGAGGVSGAIPAGTFSADRIDADLNERTIALTGRARLNMQPGRLTVPRN